MKPIKTCSLAGRKALLLSGMIFANCLALQAQDALLIAPTGEVTIDKALILNSNLTSKGQVVFEKELTVKDNLTVNGWIRANSGSFSTSLGANTISATNLTANHFTALSNMTAHNGITAKGVINSEVSISAPIIYATNGAIQKGDGKIPIGDLGLYSNNANSPLRLVTNNSPIAFYTTSNKLGGDKPSMKIRPDGSVCVGEDIGMTRALFEVYGSKVLSDKKNYGFLNVTHPTGIWSGGQYSSNISILASDRIVTSTEFNAYSDARIKKDFVRSDAEKDLALINKLQVTDYRYIDSINYGNASKKGVIAQEVEKVFPGAVNKGEEFIPDIFSKPEKFSVANTTVSFTMGKPHHLISGDLVRFITTGGMIETKVTVTGKNSFTIDANTGNYDDVFVFGKKVNDFRMVDYDRIAMLNVSATQQLSKEIDQLKKENEALKQKDVAHETAMADMQNKLQAMETSISVYLKTVSK